MKTWERQITDVVFQSLIAAFFMGLLILTGCNSPESMAFARVDGRVFLDGKPVQHARVVFIPTRATHNGWEIPFSYGSTDTEGRFDLQTETGRPGVFQGWSEVWVIELSAPEAPIEPKGVPQRYSRRMIEVVPDSNGQFSIEIDHSVESRTQKPPELQPRRDQRQSRSAEPGPSLSTSTRPEMLRGE